MGYHGSLRWLTTREHHLPKPWRFRFGSAQGGKKNVQTRNKSSQSAGKSTAPQCRDDKKKGPPGCLGDLLGMKYRPQLLFGIITTRR